MITMIWAEDDRHGIGRQQSIPWHIPDDMAFFRQTTLDHSVIMGRKTFESIGRPLPRRPNLVLTHHPEHLPSEVRGFSSYEELLASLTKTEKHFVIGGSAVYHKLMPVADELLITKVTGDFQCDVFAPVVDKQKFTLQEERPGKSVPGVPDHVFQQWVKRN